jgi:hypothetical protein
VPTELTENWLPTALSNMEEEDSEDRVLRVWPAQRRNGTE